MVKSLSTMWENWFRSLGWEDPLEKGTAPHSSAGVQSSGWDVLAAAAAAAAAEAPES